jgi:FkbM family methyltransferase
VREVTRRGVSWRVDAPDGYDFWSEWEKGWEQPTLDAVERFCGPGGTFVDVGAWIGPVSLWAARLGPVLAVEPDPVAINYLRHNCQANGADVEILKGAVSAQTGTAYIEAHEGWGSSMSRLADTGFSVRAWSMADLLKDRTVSLVKVDIEGGEAEIMQDAGPYLAGRGIPLVLAMHEPWWRRPFEMDWLSGYEHVEGDPTGWGQVLAW